MQTDTADGTSSIVEILPAIGPASLSSAVEPEVGVA